MALPRLKICAPTRSQVLLQGHGRAPGGAAALQPAARHRRPGARVAEGVVVLPDCTHGHNVVANAHTQHAHQPARQHRTIRPYLRWHRSETRPRRCYETFARSRPPRATDSRPPQSERWRWWGGLGTRTRPGHAVALLRLGVWSRARAGAKPGLSATPYTGERGDPVAPTRFLQTNTVLVPLNSTAIQ